MSLEGWRSVALSEVCEFRYGKSLPESARSGAGYPVFGSNGQVGYHVEALTSGATIVIGRKGSLGEVNYSLGPCWPIDTTYFVDSTATIADLRWLMYQLDALGLTLMNRAAAVPGLNREDAYRRRVLLPPLAEQRRIAAILDKADELRAKRRTSLAQFDTLMQSIFLDMFGDPVANPRRFPTLELSGFGAVVTGNTPPRAKAQYYGGRLEWIKSDNLSTGSYYAQPAAETLSEAGRKVVRLAPAGSILVTCIAGSRESIGNAAMLDREAAFNQQINALIPDTANPHFLYAQFRVAKRLVQAASTDAMKGMVSKSKFGAIRFINPPSALQDEFATTALALQEIKLSGQKAIDVSDDLFVSLQHRAFNGEL